MSTPPPRNAHAQSPAIPAAGGPDEAPPHRYTSRLADQIESRWQQFWDEHGTFVQPNPGQPGFDATRPKFYCLDMFPYPSGAGLHVGHPLSYTATDIVSRYMRMKGYNVLHPMGWDAFGLPAEQYAIQTGIHPSLTTKQATDNFRRQLKRFGFSYDWSREISTIDPEYYKWTQWIFLRAYNAWYDPNQPSGGKARPISELIAELEGGDLRVGVDGELVHVGGAAATGIIGGEPAGTRRWHELSADEQRAVIDNQRLAYIDEATVNWCPKLGTVLANDEVIDGRSERGGHPVLRKPLRQWMFRITAYAERLLRDLDTVDWPASTRAMQSEWIGRSEGAEIDFNVVGMGGETIRVFTTRPDTLFGATFMVVAPEHPMVQAAIELKPPLPGVDMDALRGYVAAARNRSDVDRMADTKEKTGVFTGLYCENPATGESIPVWTADYVLMGYGHGAIMAVPAHDERDFAFARKFGLPIRDVVYPRTQMAIGFFVRHATREEEESGSWRKTLADFLGLTATADMKPELLGAVLDAVRTRRVTPQSDKSSPHFTPRGVISEEYLEAIEDLGELADIREQYRSGTVFAASGAAFAGHGFAANSTRESDASGAGVTLDLLSTDAARERVIEWLEQTGRGNRKVNYKLRDWAFSRQRYWGEPFPIVFDSQGRHYPVSESALPVTLPELADYSPVESDDPMPLLAKATSWMNTTAGQAGVSPDLLPPETPVRREANTMPGSAGSSWYFLRYCDAKNRERFVGRDAERYWLASGSSSGTDIYIGGSEHAVGHLLYSRFWQKLLFDLGEVDSHEPFGRLYHQGLITSFAYQRADKTIVPTDEVSEVAEGKYVITKTGESVMPVVTKMSKRYKNVVNPDDVIAEFGADTFRMYEMYMGPLDQSKPWNTRDAVGIFRFLQRLWRLAVDEQTGELKLRAEVDAGVEKQLHRTIHKVATDIPKLAFNTAIAAIIEFVNAATSAGGLSRDQLERITLVLAPFAPHMGEELWHRLGRSGSLAYASFPVADPAMLTDDAVEVPVQISGKVRAKVIVAAGADKATHEAAAMADDKVKAALAGKTVQKVVVVPGKMINIVAS
jgi:leucyl-tRNA synthetase